MDSTINSSLNLTPSRLTSFNNSASLSESVSKEKTGTLAASRNKPDSSKIRREVLTLIEEDFLIRTYTLVEKEGGGIAGVPVAKIICDEENPQKAKKYETCINTIQEALLSLARRSDATARIIQKFLAHRQCNFFILEPDDMTKLGTNKNTVAAVYYPQLKAIMIPTTTILGEDYNLREFQDMLLHELIHASDDLLVLDTNPKKPVLYSNDVIKQQLKPFFSAELDKSRQMLESLRAIRTTRATKQAKLNNPAAKQEEINKAVEKSFAERPLHRVHIHNIEEMDVVVKNTWCWYQTNDEYVVAPFLIYANENLDAGRTKDSITLTAEYAANGLTFMLSADPAKRERFQRQAPDFHNYVKTTLLPLFNQ